jgi:hypothetical protein
LNENDGKSVKKTVFEFNESKSYPKSYPKSQLTSQNKRTPIINPKSTPKIANKHPKNSQSFNFQAKTLSSKPPTPKLATQESGFGSQRESKRQNKGKVTKEFAIMRFVHRFFQVIDTIKKCHGKHDKNLRKFLTPIDEMLHGLMRLGMDPDGFTLSEKKNESRHEGLTQMIHNIRTNCEIRAKSVYSNKKGQHKVTEAPEIIANEGANPESKFKFEHTVDMLLLDQFLNDIMKIVEKIKPDRKIYTDID